MNSIFSIWRRSICALAGGFCGGVAGALLGLYQAADPAFRLSGPEVWQMGLLLALVAWIGVLVVIGLWLHYGLRATALPALVTAVIVSIITVAIANKVHVPPLTVWIGLIVGTLIGAALCAFCRLRYTPAGAANGMR